MVRSQDAVYGLGVNKECTWCSMEMVKVMQMVVVYEHHHMDKELSMAIALSSVAAALVILSILLACIFWQRNRKDPNSKSGQGSAK
ncbi:centromere-associated protein E isoform X1 [Iris pallida]|nr:centromere-associated protein E isoform X1 [Iris pallida]